MRTMNKAIVSLFTSCAIVGATAGVASASTAPSSPAPDRVASSDAKQQNFVRTGPNRAPVPEDYYYMCVGNTGEYLIEPGQPTTDCHGHHLQYFYGTYLIESISLTAAGTPATDLTRADVNCLIAAVGATAAVLTVEGTVVWALGAAASGWGLATCRG